LLQIVIKITFPKTPFGNLVQQIRIQSYLSQKSHQALPSPQATMSPSFFKGMKQKWLSKGPAVKPIVPLEREVPEDPDDDKSKFVTMEVKNRADGKTTYKMSVRVFEEGSPQQWLQLLGDIKLIWVQNSLTKANNRIASLHAVLRGESKTAFEAALQELAVDEEGNKVEVTTNHIDDALKEVGKEVFPRRALELQRLWMLRYMRKPKMMSSRKTAFAITRMNNLLELFPDGDESSKFSESELIGLIEWCLPPAWHAKFDLDNYIPTLDLKARLIEECEAIERNLGAFDDDEDKKNKKQKKGKNAKSGGGEQKRDRGDTDKPFWCRLCKKNTSHNTNKCRILNKERAASQYQKKEEKRPFTKRTFKKEANAIARKAAKKGSLKILAKSLERQQSRLKKQASQKKKSKNDKDVDTDTDSDSGSDSDESLNIVDPVPRKTDKKTRSKSEGMIRSIDDPFANDTPEEKEAMMRYLVAKRQKALRIKKKKKNDTIIAEEAAFLEATAEKEKMDVDEEDKVASDPNMSD